MKILVACEESQRVCLAFREKGHEAYSCDIINCSGGHPEYHIMQDVLPLLSGNCSFKTCDDTQHKIEGKWDMIIAFPPCTNLCNSGTWCFTKGFKPWSLRDEGAEFFMHFVKADCDKIAIENPVGCMSTRYRKPNQIIQPYQFGHPETKRTCLWLKGLPNLKETNNVYKYMMTLPKKERCPVAFASYKKEERGRMRSKTYPGVAQAMAD